MGNVAARSARLPTPRATRLAWLAVTWAVTSALIAAPRGALAGEPAIQPAGEPGMMRTVAAPRAWERAARIDDVRYLGALSVGDQVRAGGANLDLPGRPTILGKTVDAVTIGAGWLDLRTGSSSTRLDILSGAGMRVPDDGSVVALRRADSLAVRWSPLMTPAGPAIVEVLIDPVGGVTVQYLHVPAGIDRLLAAGEARAVDPLARPSSASAYRPRATPQPVGSLPGMGPSAPKSNDPPPAGCVAEPGSWCDRADGPGVSEIYLNEDFNDSLSASRGWTGTDAWHEIPFAICSPGATANPGRSWYYGEDVTCLYAPSSQGSLFSPLVGPITTGTVINYQFRGGFEDPGETLDVYVNGNLLIRTPTLPDPTLWYHWTFPLDLSAYAGQMIQLEYRFTSNSANQFLGWMIDDVQVWNPNSANVPCVMNAGKNGNSDCGDRVNTTWTFYETNFCQACTYSLYVLVECGREMHMPLDDMEGADIQVTSMITGLPVPLRCVNQTALADAGLGPYRGVLANCCSNPPGDELWWGPAFDVTDNAGPGHVTWGFGSPRCGSVLEYDLACGNDDGALTCGEIDGTGGCGGCGGLLPLLGPGESQTVDCSIADPDGLCGLYRVDISSGGNLWNLFANCDGTNTPNFKIFHDCAEAWLAYNPLPELAIANLTTQNGCPALLVDFDVQNLGCKDHVGDVTVRLSSNCVPPDTFDHVVVGGIPVGGSVHVSIPFAVTCSPVRVEVAADPDNVIEECTESLTIASCRADRGVDSLATFTCGCTAQLIADAGPDLAGCPGEPVVLDAGASSIAPCANPEYRWTNEAGTIVQDWSAAPTYSAPAGPCPGGQTYTLDVRCQGEGCMETTSVRVDCQMISADAGPVEVKACVGEPVVLDASASTISNCQALEYRWFDQLGAEVRGWGADPTLDLGGLTCANAGIYELEVRCAGNGSCSGIDNITVTCVDLRANAGPDLITCEGLPLLVSGERSITTGCDAVSYAWFDETGAPLTPYTSDPSFPVQLLDCPGLETLVLRLRCDDPGLVTCGSLEDSLEILCPQPPPPIPTATPTCGRSAMLACGASDPGVSYWWDIDTSVDADMDGDPANDQHISGCDVSWTWPTAGSRGVRCWSVESTASCTNFADTLADSFDDPLPPAPSAIPACPGQDTSLSCGLADPGLTYAWDIDIATDSNGDTLPANDADAAGCDIAWPYGEGAFDARVRAVDARGCAAAATIRVVISAAFTPAEVTGDLITRSGASLTLTWPRVAGATSTVVARGLIGSWYSHSADDAAGQGACSTGDVTTWTDPDDAADGFDYYYLLTALEPCGTEGSPGTGFDGSAAQPRDARIPSAACP